MQLGANRLEQLGHISSLLELAEEDLVLEAQTEAEFLQLVDLVDR